MNNRLQAVIVDDEALGRERLRMLLNDFPDVVICEECDGGLAAVEAIRKTSPDIVFLDIQMPEVDGFGVLSRLKMMSISVPFIVFVTAFSEHAVRAFEVNAIDYLLKPVLHERLAEAIHRARSLKEKSNIEEWRIRCGELLVSMQDNNKIRQIEIRSVGMTEFVNVDDVVRLQADGNYIEVHTAKGCHLARMTLSEFERQLDPAVFLRISRSAIVNLKYVRSIRSNGRRGYTVQLHDGQVLGVSRGIDQLRKRLKFTS